MAGVQKRPASYAIGKPKRSGEFFWSQEHKLALERLRFAATSRAPLTTFTGQIGTGRTSLLRELLKVEPSGFVVGTILLPKQASGVVFADVLAAFGATGELPDDKDDKELALSEYLYALHSAQKVPTLIVDDADVLSTSYLLTLCSLSQTSAGQWPLLKIILVGRPGLTQLLNTENPDLAGPSLVLEGMSEEDVAEYIRLRISSAEGSKFHFAPEAIEEICSQTRRVPGRINRIVDACLLEAAKRDAYEIDRSIVRLVAALAAVRGPGDMTRARSPRTSPGSAEAFAVSAPSGEPPSAHKSGAEPGDGADALRASQASLPGEHHRVRAFGRIDRVALGALTAIFLLGAATISYVSISGTSFADLRALLGSSISALRAGVAGMGGPDPAANDGLDTERVMAAQVKANGISEMLSGTEPSASSQFSAALDLAETAADAAVVGYARAALAGHERAAYYLGQIYETGEGVPVDLSLAKAWYEMAGPQIDGAVQRLTEIFSPQVDGNLLAPTPLYSGKLPGGSAELVWTSGAGRDPSSYRIELATKEGDMALSAQPILISAIRLTPPWDAVRWRVIAIGGRGQEVASPWLEIAPE